VLVGHLFSESVNLHFSTFYHQLSSFAVSNHPETEGFGRFAPPVEVGDDKHDEEEEEESVSEENSEFISSAELRRNRMSSKG